MKIDLEKLEQTCKDFLKDRIGVSPAVCLEVIAQLRAAELQLKAAQEQEPYCSIYDGNIVEDEDDLKEIFSIYDHVDERKILKLYAAPVPADHITGGGKKVYGTPAVAVPDSYITLAEKLITKVCCIAVERLNEVAPERGWDSGEVVAEIYIRELREKLAVMESQEDPNHCALKSITDDQVRKVAKAFWRRIYAYRNDYGIELPDPMPVEFMAHMATALTWVDKPVPADKPARITEQDAREIARSYSLFCMSEARGDEFAFDDWVLSKDGEDLLDKLNAGRADHIAEAGKMVDPAVHGVAELAKALELALEYWGHRQKRYKNRRPQWVVAAESALSAHHSVDANKKVSPEIID